MPKVNRVKRAVSIGKRHPAGEQRANWRKLALWDSGCTLLAIAIAWAYYLAWLDIPILHDAAGYVRAAKDILANGLFSQYELSDIRTYGWPLMLSWLIRLSVWTGLSLRVVGFGFELLFHLFACWLFRRALRRTAMPAALATLLAVSLLLNPLVLLFTTYLLTESVSFSLLILLLAGSAYVLAATGKKRLYLALLLGSLVLGVSIMIRPANVCMVPVWWAVSAAALWQSKPGLAKGLCGILLTLLFTFLPMTPQWLNNVRYYQTATPLPVVDIAHQNTVLGIRIIKYATAYLPDPRVIYENPFFDKEPVDVAAPLSWYTSHPAKGLATVGLHFFNLLDQDLPFPYTTTLLPTYYPLAALANMLMVFFGVIGLVLAGRHVYLRNREGIPLSCVALATLVCQVGMYAFLPVETRFGVPALMVLYMFASWLLAYEVPRSNTRKRITVLILAGTATASSYPLSAWVRQQSPAIREALRYREGLKEVPQILKSMNPAGKFVSGELANWSAGDAGVGPEGEAVLCAVGPAPYSIFYHPVALAKSTDYIVEFEARAPAGVTSELSVDLYAGASYDKIEQNSVFASFSNKYERFKAMWNSGPNAPAEAFLRFVTASKTPIQFRHVVFYQAAR